MVGRGAAMMLLMALKTYWLRIALTAAATRPPCYEVTMIYICICIFCICICICILYIYLWTEKFTKMQVTVTAAWLAKTTQSISVLENISICVFVHIPFSIFVHIFISVLENIFFSVFVHISMDRQVCDNESCVDSSVDWLAHTAVCATIQAVSFSVSTFPFAFLHVAVYLLCIPISIEKRFKQVAAMFSD